MKISKIFLPLLAAAALTFTGCDSFLDIKPVGKVIPQTADEFRALLTEAYLTVPDDRGLASLRSDEIQMDTSLDPNDISSYLDIWRWKDDASDQNTATFSWRQFYHVLFIANYIIESEQSISGGTTADIRQIVGEAYMLRAYMHFILANLHAPAYTACDPATTKAIPLRLNSDVENMLTRDNLARVYKSITDDLDTAEKYLNVSSWKEGLNYRFTTVSADAIRSRVLLYMGQWEGAQKAAERVIEARPELVSSGCPNVYNSVENIVALEQVFNNSYTKSVKVQRELYSLYASTDRRRPAYFDYQSARNIRIAKGGSNSFCCTVRTGEMYLNAAEAACRRDLDSDARTFLAAIQRARYTDADARIAATEALSGDALLEEILKERRLELAFEGHRWFDLRRNGMPRLERSYGGETFVLEQGDPRYTIRIPAEAITANPGLAN